MDSLTKEQERVVTTLGKNLLVSASAGSGKTHTMIERIVYLLKTQEISIKNMLVVTFTEAAASEMRTRIENALMKEAGDNDKLKQELEHLSTADISTLHTFCSKIIKQYFYEVGIDPAYQILEPESSTVFKNSSLDAILHHYIKKDDEVFNELFENYNHKRRDVEFKNSILNLYNFLKTKYDYKNYIKNIVDKTYTTNLKNNLSAIYLHHHFMEMVEHFTKIFTGYLIEASALKSDKLMLLCEDTLKELNLVGNKTNFEETVNAVNQLEGFMRMPGKVADDEIELKEKIKEDRDLLKKELSNFSKIVGEGEASLKETLKKAKPLLEKMLEVIEAFDAHYAKTKKEHALLDFNDLEYYALEILKNETIQKSVKEKYDYVFIDEYQDTNNIQEQILSNIVKEDNAFMVGDVKQSIYGFRECDPTIFLRKYEAFKKEKNSEKIDLNANFRSDLNVLEFVNFVFNKIMKFETAQIDYKNTSEFVFEEEFYNYKPSKNNNPMVCVSVIDTKEKDEEKEEEPLEEIYSVLNHIEALKENKEEKDTKVQKEAKVIAGKIYEFLNSEIYDVKLKEYRKVTFQDIAILTRVKKEFIKTLAEELEALAIPVKAKYENNIYETYEANLIYNVLKLINNEQDDVALVSVLSSPICNISYNELSNIRLCYPDKAFYYEALFEYVSYYKDETSRKIKTLLKDLEEFRKKLTYLNVPYLIREVLNKYELNNYFLSLPNGKERLENIKRLIVATNKPKIQDNLFEYLSYIETFGSSETFEVNKGVEENSVTITTIHASKGLEYPIVILAGAGRDFKRAGSKMEILTSKDFGFGVRYYDLENRMKKDTLVRNAIHVKNLEEEQEEEMRLLYVALTRAKNHLVILGGVDLQKINALETDYSIKNARSYMEWILGSLDRVNLNTLKEERRELNVTLTKNIDCKFEVISEKDLLEKQQEEKQLVFGKPNETYVNAFEKMFAFTYPFIESKDILNKSSPSAIMQQEEEETVYSIRKMKVDEVYNKKEDTDFSLIGRVHHSIMEHISFTLTKKEEVEEEIKKLITNGTLPLETFDLVDVSQILNAILKVGDLLKNAVSIRKEQQFMMYVPYNSIMKESKVEDKILIQGVIDLIVETQEERIILDYKTTRLNEKALREKYKTQLMLYEKAVEGVEGSKKPVKKLIYSFHLNNIVNV